MLHFIDRCITAAHLFRHYRRTGLPLRYSAVRAWRFSA